MMHIPVDSISRQYKRKQKALMNMYRMQHYSNQANEHLDGSSHVLRKLYHFHRQENDSQDQPNLDFADDNFEYFELLVRTTHHHSNCKQNDSSTISVE
jgi:hypothetical protein